MILCVVQEVQMKLTIQLNFYQVDMFSELDEGVESTDA